MRFSIVRIDKKRVLHLSLKSAESFLERIKTNTKSQDIGELRRHIATYGDDPDSERQATIAKVYPSVELDKTGNGNLEIVAFNGLVALHVPELLREEDRQAVKEASKMMPMTFAAFEGADGRSVEILVSVARDDGLVPTRVYGITKPNGKIIITGGTKARQKVEQGEFRRLKDLYLASLTSETTKNKTT